MRLQRISVAIVLVVLVGQAGNLSLLAQPEAFEQVESYEELQGVQLLELPRSYDGEKQKFLLTFAALGENFELELEPARLYTPDAVVRWVTAAGENLTTPNSVGFYRGRIPGESDTWVRMSIRNQQVSGLIRTSSEIYLLRPAVQFNRQADPRASVIFRLSEQPSLWESYTCGVADDIQTSSSGASAMSDYRALLEELPDRSEDTLLMETEIHLVADGAYYSSYGASAADRMADVINDVSGIYENEVGVTFRISGVTVYTPAADPLTSSTDSGTLLSSFTYDVPHSTGHDLAHLFTGRDLDGSVIGIAWLGVVCRNPVGTGLSQDLGGEASRMMLTAHEIGHNFSAIHDGIGNCASEPYGYIMWPSLNSNASGFSGCSESYMNTHISSRTCLSEIVPPVPGMEIGKVAVDDEWKTVALERSFSDPIVIAKPPSYEGTQPAVVRIRNVTSSSFEVRIQEWEYLDSIHAIESVSYLVLEGGQYEFENGARMEALALNLANTGTSNFASVNLQNTFASAPIVLTSVGSYNDTKPVTTRVRNVSTTGFEVTMQEEEAGDQVHSTETIYCLAWDVGSGTADGLEYEAASIEATEVFHWIPEHDLQLKVEEEQSIDTEIIHAQETIGYLLIHSGQSEFLLADFQTTSGPDPAGIRWKSSPFDVASVALNDEWVPVGFASTFSNPVVVATPLSRNGTDPAVIRMRNVSSSGVEMRVQNWDYLGSDHPTEEVSLLVIEAGRSRLANGTGIEAGTVELAGSESASYTGIDFETHFDTPPVVITTINSFQGSQAVVTRVKNVTTHGFELLLQEEEANDQFHLAETVSYIAIEPGSMTLLGVPFEVGMSDGVSHNSLLTSFSSPFSSAPCLLADMQTTRGPDTANLRLESLDASGFESRVTEEQSRNTEMIHTSELIGFVGIGCSELP